MLLATENVDLSFAKATTNIIKLPSSAIKGKTVEINRIHPGARRMFLLHPISPVLVGPAVFSAKDDVPR